MNATELMSNAITNGLTDDATTSAALDAIREESGCSLLSAVLEVARVYHAARSARELTEATGHLAEGSPIKAALEEDIMWECWELIPPPGAMIVVVEGDQWPRSPDASTIPFEERMSRCTITVGAKWVLLRAEKHLRERTRRRRTTRPRKSR